MDLKAQLTPSEYQVAELVTRGYSEKEIASQRFVSENTVRTHTQNIRKKIGARSAVDVARQFILSLENPKHFFVAVFFFGVQGFIIAQNASIEIRKPHRVHRVARRVKNK